MNSTDPAVFARRAGRAEDGSLVDITLTSTTASGADLADMVAELEQRWPPRGLERARITDWTEVRLRIDIDGSGAVRVDGADGGGGWDRVESAIGLFAAEHLTARVAVHAAVLVTDHGAIVLPGATHTGKSTLARAARQRGLLVLGDEYALVDTASGAVQGWPRPLRTRRPSHVERTPLDEAEQVSAFTDHSVALVAVLTYSPASPSIRPVSRVDMVIEVLRNTVCARVRPEASVSAAMAMTSNALLVVGTRGESDATIDVLLEQLERQRPPA
ncbi:MAG: hypothetical protein ACO4CU_11165 [Ilumatobacteraceae bacterium]